MSDSDADEILRGLSGILDDVHRIKKRGKIAEKKAFVFERRIGRLEQEIERWGF